MVRQFIKLYFLCLNLDVQTGTVLHGIRVKSVPNKGHGLFAREFIEKGAYLCEYIGYASNASVGRTPSNFSLFYSEIIDREEANKREGGYVVNRYEFNYFEQNSNKSDCFDFSSN